MTTLANGTSADDGCVCVADYYYDNDATTNKDYVITDEGKYF